MSGKGNSDQQPRTPSAMILMVLISLSLHVALVSAVSVLAKPGLHMPLVEAFEISLDHPPLQLNNLPPLEGSKDAGPLTELPQQVQQPVEEPEAQEREAPEEEPPQPEEKPAEKEKPAERREADTKPEEKEKETRIVSTRGSESKPVEKPEPKQETPQQLRQQLQSRGDVLSQSRSVGGSTMSQHFAMEGDGEGGVPDTIRKTLMSLIWRNWNPPYQRIGEIKEAIVEFTLYSPPLADNAVNESRPRSRLTELELVKSSGDDEFDRRAIDAIRRLRTMSLPPLPQYYKKSRLVVSCRFYYIGDEGEER